jgi:hypothetical protein
MKAHRYWIVFALSWLLWVHSWPVKKDGSVETWSVDSSFETKEECEAAAVKVAGDYDFYVKERWNLKGKREYKQICLLDTVNPREMKTMPKGEAPKDEAVKGETPKDEAVKGEAKETPKEKQ